MCSGKPKFDDWGNNTALRDIIDILSTDIETKNIITIITIDIHLYLAISSLLKHG